MTYRRRSRWPARAMAVLTLLVVAGSAGAGWWLCRPDQAIGPAAPGASGRVAEPERPETVQPGRDYYAHVRLIEFTPEKPGGGAWDPRGRPPDIFHRIYWNGTRIFESSARSNRLIAEWDLLSLGLRDALLSGQIEVSAAINAPIINVQEGGILTIDIYDEDTFRNDHAGKLDLPVDTLRIGLNTLRPENTGIVRILLEMVPRDTPLPDLLDRASQRQ